MQAGRQADDADDTMHDGTCLPNQWCQVIEGCRGLFILDVQSRTYLSKIYPIVVLVYRIFDCKHHSNLRLQGHISDEFKLLQNLN